MKKQTHSLIGALTLGLAMVGTVPALAADAPPAEAASDQAARLTAAGKLVETMHLDQQLQAIIPQFINLMMNALVTGNNGHEDQIRTILNEEIMTAFAAQQPAMQALYREVYARNLTLAELNAMEAFYASAIGQSVLKKTPQLTQDSMSGGVEMGRKAAESALPHIVQRMQAAKLQVPKGV